MADIKFLDQEGLTTVLSKLANGDLKMTGTLAWKNDGNGSVLGLNTYNHYIDVGSGYINFSSDKRLKENIQDITNLLDNVLAANIKTFNFISNPDETCIGVIAQEIEENFKDSPLKDVLVKTNKDGMLSVNETKFVYVVWEAFKEYVAKTDKKIEELKSQIEKLKGE